MTTPRRFSPRLTAAALACLLLLLVNLAHTAPPPGKGGGGGGGSEGPPEGFPTFTYQSLGTLGGATSTAEGINDLGEVVGNADQTDGTSAPYLYTPGSGMQKLDDLTEGPLEVPGRTLFGPDGRFYVANQGAYSGGGSVAVFDPVTGDYIADFVEFGSGGLDRPADMTFGPDGDLYVPSYSGEGTNRSRIARYDGTTGEYLGDFVPYGSGGVDGISGVTFGTDVDGDGEPDLFVSSNLTNEVLAYSGVDGLPLGVFVADGAGSLDAPGTLRFRDLDGDGTPELLVSSRLSASVIVYSGLDGSFLFEFANVFAHVDRTEDFQFGPDGDLYITARPEVETINGIDDQAQVLRCDGETGAFVGTFVSPDTGGYSSGAPRMTFDANGDLLLNSGNTNQILRFEGPGSANPGQFVDVFVDGVCFLLITARDINSSGQIVGIGHPLGRRNLFGTPSAYLYTPPSPGEIVGRVGALGVPGLNYEEEATALNDDGDVVGYFRSEATGVIHAFLYTAEDGVIDLGTLAGGDTYATGITARSGGDVLVCGYAVTGSGQRAWRYDTATGTMQDLGLISGSSGSSYAWDINDDGSVVGVAAAGNNDRAFLSPLAGSLTDLGTLGGNDSVATGINLFGDVVGMSDTHTRANKNQYQAFLRTAADGIHPLEPQITNLPGSMSLKIRPHRISLVGEICGPSDRDPSGVAFVLTPEP